jgi:hypothetical protein
MGFFIIFNSIWGKDEPQTLRYAITLNCSMGADGGQREDILGNNVLPAGQAGTVTIFDGQTECEYDMRFVFDDGSEMVDTVNVCELGSYRLYE